MESPAGVREVAQTLGTGVRVTAATFGAAPRVREFSSRWCSVALAFDLNLPADSEVVERLAKFAFEIRSVARIDGDRELHAEFEIASGTELWNQLRPQPIPDLRRDAAHETQRRCLPCRCRLAASRCPWVLARVEFPAEFAS